MCGGLRDNATCTGQEEDAIRGGRQNRVRQEVYNREDSLFRRLDTLVVVAYVEEVFISASDVENTHTYIYYSGGYSST